MRDTQKDKDKRQVNDIETNIAVILTKVQYIEGEVKDIKDRMEKDYVTRDQFAPIEKLVYGVVGIIGTAFITAIAYFFINIKK